MFFVVINLLLLLIRPLGFLFRVGLFFFYVHVVCVLGFIISDYLILEFSFYFLSDFDIGEHQFFSSVRCTQYPSYSIAKMANLAMTGILEKV